MSKPTSVQVKTTASTEQMLEDIMAYARANPMMIYSEYATKRITKNAVLNSLIANFYLLFLRKPEKNFMTRQQELMAADEPFDVKQIRKLLRRIDQLETENLMINLSSYASSKSNLTPDKVSSENQLGNLADQDSLIRQWHNHFREKMDHDVTVNRQTNYR